MLLWNVIRLFVGVKKFNDEWKMERNWIANVDKIVISSSLDIPSHEFQFHFHLPFIDKNTILLCVCDVHLSNFVYFSTACIKAQNSRKHFIRKICQFIYCEGAIWNSVKSIRMKAIIYKFHPHLTLILYTHIFFLTVSINRIIMIKVFLSLSLLLIINFHSTQQKREMSERMRVSELQQKRTEQNNVNK